MGCRPAPVKTSKLYEFGEWVKVNNPDNLRRLLLAARSAVRQLPGSVSEEDQNDASIPFLEINRDFVRAKNYVGFIQNGDELIEIYPKVFGDKHLSNEAMLQHILHWLSRSYDGNILFLNVDRGTQRIDNFPELILYLMARQFHDTLTTQPRRHTSRWKKRCSRPGGVSISAVMPQTA